MENEINTGTITPTPELVPQNKRKIISDNKATILIFIMFFVAGLYATYLALNNYNPNVSDDSIDTFTDCLILQNVSMYGTTWCHYCNQEKELFGKTFSKINFVDCDLNNSNCAAMGVDGYPTWFINGQKYVGLQSLEKLSSITGCELQ